jgi:phytoene dehydrogenase-like protein
MWQELGAVQGRQFIDHDVMLRIQAKDGRALSVYADIDRLERHMKELSPSDSALIEEFCHGARRLSRYTELSNEFDKPSGLLDGIKMMIKLLPFMNIFQKYGSVPGETFFGRFRDPFLRQALLTLLDVHGGGAGCPVMGVMYMLAYLHNRNGGYPVGGSLEFARGIERRYLDLGGEITALRSKIVWGGQVGDRARRPSPRWQRASC